MHDVSESLAAIISNADDSDATYDEAGKLLRLESSDAALLYPWAISALYVENCVLHSRVKPGDKPWLL